MWLSTYILADVSIHCVRTPILYPLHLKYPQSYTHPHVILHPSFYNKIRLNCYVHIFHINTYANKKPKPY